MSQIKKLTALTAEQEVMLPMIRDKWLKVGLSTQPADRETAKAAAILTYKKASLKEPNIFVWLDSPMAGCIGAYMLAQVGAQVRAQVGAQVRAQVWDQVGAQVWDQVRAQVWDQVRAQVGAQVGAQVWAQVWDQVGAQVWDQVGAQVGAQVWAQVRAQVGAQVGDQVGDQVWDQVRDQVRAQVRAQVWDQVGDQVRAQVGAQVGAQVWDQVRAQVGAQVWAQVWDQVGDQRYRCGYGLHDANWIGFYDAFAQFGIDTSRLDGVKEMTESCGWWWPFTGAVVMTERPIRLERDDRNRLHSATGKAIEYPDGWGIYAWHGVRVSEQVIMKPDTMTGKQILDERNAEIRRVMVERFGLDRFLSSVKAKILHQDQSGSRKLHRIDLAGDEPIVAVQVKCPTTGQIYFLRVPPTITRCDTAVAWTFGYEHVADYQPSVET